LVSRDLPGSSLIDYIAAAKAQGADDSFLVDMLERSGWPRKEIYAAFGTFYGQLTGLETPRRVSGLADSARDAFLYLLSFGTLAVWTLGLGSLFFTLIDIRYSDPVFPNVYVNVRDSLSGSMASLIIGFPVYLITMRILLRDLKRKPDKAESDVRKWLTYIALLISAGTVIGDLVTFVEYFLRGQFTTPFLLKVLTVLVIAGTVFWYYLAPLERLERER
jgi:membrane protein YqaA with SNARE-associated domain